MQLEIYYDSQRHLVTKPYDRTHLHLAARLLGIKRCWFSARPYPHYDIPARQQNFNPVMWALEADGNALDFEDETGEWPEIKIFKVTPREILSIIKTLPLPKV